MMTREEHAANKANGSYKFDRWGNQVPDIPVRHSQTGDVITNVRRRAADSSVSREVFNDPQKMQALALREMGRYAEADKLDGLGAHRINRSTSTGVESAMDSKATDAKQRVQSQVNLLRRQGRQCEANLLAERLKAMR